MKYRSERIASNNRSLNAVRAPSPKLWSVGDYTLYVRKAFTLVEVLTALAILAFISSSVVGVINRCTASAADSVLRIQAFGIARENMEKLLASDSVTEMVEYGTSEKFPAIQWETKVEVFSEPLNSTMWARGTCSADYTDTEGEEQTVELTHWLTDLTDAQMLKIDEDEEEQIIETIEEAAEYADVDEETIQQWVDNGMLLTKEGYYFKFQLDLYKTTDGNPTVEQRNQVAEIYPDVLKAAEEQPGQDRDPTDDKDRPLSERDPRKMSPEEIQKLVDDMMEQFR